MYKRIVNYLQGSDLVQVECACPERVLNLCSAEGVPFWDLRWQSEILLTLRLPRRFRGAMDSIAERTGATVVTLRRRGAPVLWGRLRRRYVLAAALVAFWLALFGGNLFIWEFRVYGNETVPAETILHALDRCGVRVGTAALRVDQENIRNHVLLEVKDLSWLAVNVKGCVAYVQVVERKRPPQQVEEGVISNVVARRDGLVTQVRALGGRAQVQAGETVTTGQLLISGVVEQPNGKTWLTHGMGTVEARTWYELTAAVPLEKRERGEEASKKRAWRLDFGKRQIKLWGRGSITGPDCDKIIRYDPLMLPGGLRLPVTLVTEETTVYQTETAPRTAEEARQEGEAQLRAYLQQMLGENGSITETHFEAERQGQWLRVTMQAECLEQIGRETPVEREN